MILSAVRHVVAGKFIQFCGGTCVNKRSHVPLQCLCNAVARKQWLRWLTNFSQEAYYVWLHMHCMALPQVAVPSGESTIGVLLPNSRKLVHGGLTKPSRLSLADRGALRLRIL